MLMEQFSSSFMILFLFLVKNLFSIYPKKKIFVGLTKLLFRFLQEFGILVFSMALDLQGHNQRWYILLSLDFLHYFYHLFLISTTLCFTFVLCYAMPFGKSVVMLIPSLIKII